MRPIFADPKTDFIFSRLVARALHPLLLALIGAMSLWMLFDAAPTGDENFYLGSARLLANLASGQGSLTAVEVFDRIRDKGWFLPGVSLILTVVELLVPGEAPRWALRAWMLALNLGLLGLLVAQVRRRFGHRAATVCLLLCAASPYFVAHLSSLFGGAAAILATLNLFLWVDRWQPAELAPRRAAVAGILAAGIVYLRGMYLPIPLILLVALFLIAAKKRQVRRFPACAVALTLSFAALLAPWSWWVSRELGFTVTTTSMSWSQLAALGDTGLVQQLRREGGHGNLSYDLHRAITARAARNDVSFRQQVREERRRVFSQTTPRELLDHLGRNVRRYASTPAGFLDRFLAARCRGRAGCLPEPIGATLSAACRGSWLLCAGLLFAYMLVPFRLQATGRWLAFFGKALVFMIWLHCFVAYAHDRYYFQLFPVAGLVAAAWVGRRPAEPRPEASRLHDGLLGAGQVFAAGFALVVAGLFFLV